jgi:hypothetical protein
VAQISAPIRIVALIGLLSALALGAWMTLQSAGGAAGPAADATAAPNAAEAAANAVASKLNAHNLNTAAGKPDTTVPATVTSASKPRVAPAVKHPAKVKAPPKSTAPQKVKATPKRKTPAQLATARLPTGTPTTIGSLLATHGVVVVLLYDPKAGVDSYSLGEAVLGAQEASAGFLRVNVLDQAQALPFAKAYGVLQDPTILFFVRPGKLVQKLVGFADHETIAQAATNEALKAGWVPSAAQRKLSAAATVSANSNLASWSRDANAVCRSHQVPSRQALAANASDAEGTAYIRGIESQIDQVVAGLTALPLPAAASQRALISAYIGSVKKMRVDYEAYLQAQLKRDQATAKARFAALGQGAAKQQTLERQLSLTACG